MWDKNFNEINLLPKQYIFDINKYIAIRRIIILSIGNIFLLIIITLNLFYQIKMLQKNITIAKNNLAAIISLNKRFKPFLTKYSKLQEKIHSLENKKKLYYINYDILHSPLISFLILEKNIIKGIRINKLSYSNGSFTFTGFAKTGKDYYNFYKKLDSNHMIKNVKFFYVTVDKDTHLLLFKMSIMLKTIK